MNDPQPPAGPRAPEPAALAPPPAPGRAKNAWAAAVVFGLFMLAAWQLTGRPYLDHDVYHWITLWRDTLASGWVPREDLYSFLPTLRPCVDYEWGTGAILYYLAPLGGAGIALVRALLLAGIIAACARCARRAGASWLTLAVAAPLWLLLIGPSFSPVRAQLFTMLFVALELAMFDADRRGRRWWPVLWLPMYLLWLNLHGGFVLGPVLLGAHWFEQVIRTRRPQWHLIATGLAAIPVTLVNPWGSEYIPFMLHALSMKKPILAEWGPLWHDPSATAMVLLLLLIAAYAVHRRGLASTGGVLILACIAVQSFLHLRHVQLLLVAWACMVPAWLAGSPLVEALERSWRQRPWLLGASCAVLGLVLLPVVRPSAWRVVLPVSPEDRYPVMMPVGAVSYLRERGYSGRLMTPFQGSSYIPWHLPNVKIGMDSRYETAYQAGVAEEIGAMYQAEAGWRETLEKWPPDEVLVARTAKLAAALAAEAGWRRVYRDDAFEIYTRAGAAPIDPVYRTGVPLDRSFP